ncbi:MAG TPA: hypothetical protein VJV39_13940 [Dongiaceae bacterium]|nr:hypothetical protein [Dongiaceae bacterium]
MIAAIAGLGMAAYGLVDASKFLRGGVSNVGYSHIRTKLAPFDAALTTIMGNAAWDTIYANWVNGVSTPDQKAAAKALIRLGLTAANAPDLAKVASLDPDEFQTTIAKVQHGADLEPIDLNLLGQFDAFVSAMLDAAYERADQQYRNSAKALAVVVAVVLAVFGGNILRADDTAPYYFVSKEFWAAVLIGVIATPLAPIAKDLATALTSAVQALQGKR